MNSPSFSDSTCVALSHFSENVTKGSGDSPTLPLPEDYVPAPLDKPTALLTVETDIVNAATFLNSVPVTSSTFQLPNWTLSLMAHLLLSQLVLCS